MSELLGKEINEANFVNLANDCVGIGLIPTGLKNFELAERFAKQEAIGFARWVDSMGYTDIGEDRWESYNNMSGVSADDLYNLYIQSRK